MPPAAVPFERLFELRPGLTAANACGFHRLEPGETVASHAHAAAEVLLCLTGGARIDAGGESADLSSGQVLVIETGTPHAITQVHQPTILMWVREGGQGPVPETAPGRAMASPGRQGHSLALDSAKTFVPALLSRRPGDLMVRLPGARALNDLQAREVRKCCVQNRQALAVLCLHAEPAHIEAKAFDKELRANTRHLRPHVVSLCLDPVDDLFPEVFQAVREYWLPWARVDNFQLAFQFAFRSWSEAEWADLSAWLDPLAPAHWGVVLEWNQDLHLADQALGRARLLALLPWLKAVVCLPEEAQALGDFLNPLGWQGWIVVD
ncbi:MAG: cupin domain-containing protein [Sumerlaeia bacterium]